MNHRNILLVINILVTVLVLVECNIDVQFKKCRCTVHDPKTIQNVSCAAKPINRTTTLINMSGNIIRKVYDVFINVQLNKRTTVMFRPFLFNFTRNYCDFLATNRGGPYLRLIYPMYAPYTNLNHTCPYFGFVYIKQLPLTADKLQSVWPAGVYRLDVLAFEKYRNIITMQFFYEMKEPL